MPTPTTSDPRAWRADTLDGPDRWSYPLSDRCLSVFDPIVRRLRREPRPLADVALPADALAACAREVRPMLDGLETGRGFAVVAAPSGYPAADLTALYWLTGQLLGKPFEQNVQGTVLYDVRDTGQDVRYGARFSVTNAESTFHTDNSFGDDVLDYVGLLCLNPARSGGLSQIVSAHAVHAELAARHPDVCGVLERSFHIDRRGGVRPGEPPTAQFPIFAWDGAELLCRYLRYWIEVGHEKAGVPLTADQVAAMDTLDRVAAEPALRAEFLLRPGEMLFVNNRWILHNRTAFEDFAEPERKRHYVRLWLQRRG
jgi:hypothetical protein